jgi:tetratricopeptide (TPR) repeat protein
MDSLYRRALVRRDEGRTDEALVDLREVIEREPGMFNAYHAADRILSRLRRFDDCIDLWNRYLRVDPRNAAAVFERGGAHFHLKNYPQALADAKLACELGKQDACKVADDLGQRMQR